MMATLKRVVMENWMQSPDLRQSDVMAPPLFYLPIPDTNCAGPYPCAHDRLFGGVSHHAGPARYL